MKNKLYNILPSWLKQLKHSYKIAHAFYGTLFYLFCALLISEEISLFLTFTLAVGVEIYDKYNGGNSDTLDALATVLIPTILFLL